MDALLTRLTTIGESIIGRLDVGGNLYWTLEDIKEYIPSGSYKCIPHGWQAEPVHILRVWEITNVPERTGILFHAGNTDKDTLGCVLVGNGVRQGQLIESALALDIMRQSIGPKGFSLTIVDKR